MQMSARTISWDVLIYAPREKAPTIAHVSVSLIRAKLVTAISTEPAEIQLLQMMVLAMIQPALRVLRRCLTLAVPDEDEAKTVVCLFYKT